MSGIMGLIPHAEKVGCHPFRLWHLFEKLDRIPGDWRMRLSSIETAEINDDFISAAANAEHLCPQFHPALQSGSTTVLRRMRRRYSVESVSRKNRLQCAPGSTTPLSRQMSSSAFPVKLKRSLRKHFQPVNRLGFMKIHIFFRTVQRKSTPAAEFPEPGTGIGH